MGKSISKTVTDDVMISIEMLINVMHDGEMLYERAVHKVEKWVGEEWIKLGFGKLTPATMPDDSKPEDNAPKS